MVKNNVGGRLLSTFRPELTDCVCLSWLGLTNARTDCRIYEHARYKRTSAFSVASLELRTLQTVIVHATRSTVCTRVGSAPVLKL